MRIITRIGAPFPGEHIAGVQPDLSPEVSNHWNVRLNLYTGRALSDTALKQEQHGRAGRLATRGQMVSAGIVSGLDVALERGEEPQHPRYYYHVGPGMGLTASGEDVVVRQSLRTNVLDVQVCGPAALFATGDGESGGSSGAVVDANDGSAHQVGGWTLGRLLQHRATHGIHEHPGPSLPRVGVLMLQPVEGEVIDRANGTDPCEEDPQNYAFEDQQIVDASRLLWYVWPTAWRRLPKADRLRRNQIAYAIFDAEQANGPEDLLPWESFGVPLALVAFNRRWKPLFADRNAVARAGGKPRRRTSAIANAGSPFLWQARLEQFAEHVAEIAVPRPVTQQWDAAHFDMRAYAAPALSRQFRFLPPAGLLPRAVMNFTTRSQTFFPSTYRVDALPVPLEQLDVAMEGSAALAPFDTFVPDEVQILVPVPQVWFEPNLLSEEVVSPTFNETIDALVLRRSKWLLRRLVVRQRKAVFDRAIDGQEQFYPDVDPAALDADETMASSQVDSTVAELAKPEQSFGTTDDGRDLLSTALAQLRDYLADETPLYDDVSRTYFDLEKMGIGPDIETRASELVQTGLTADLARAQARGEFNDEFVRQMPALLKGKMSYDGARRHLMYTARAEPMSDAEWQQLRALSTDPAYLLAVDMLAGKASVIDPRLAAVTVGPRVFDRFSPLSAFAPLRSSTLPFVRYAPRVPSNRAHLLDLPFPKSRLVDVASGKVWYDEVAKQLVYTPRREGMTEAERDALLTAPPPPGPPASGGSPLVRASIFKYVFLGQQAPWMGAVHGLYARSQQNELMQFDRLGLRKFIDYLAKKIAAGNDKVDLSFARVQADIYRVRQLMLGSNAATRLATSPVLASIAKGESAFATQETIKEFVAEVKAVGPRVEGPDLNQFVPPRLGDNELAGAAQTVHTAAERPLQANVFATALLAARTPVTAAMALPQTAASKEAVVGQQAIVGRALDFRSVTVAERLEQPKAPEVKNSAVATKASLIADLAAVGMNVDDLEIPGFNAYDDTGKLVQYELVLQGGKVKRVVPQETRLTFLEVAGRGVATQILQGYHDLDPVDGDESAFFAMAVRALDHAVAVLRMIEGRVQAYNAALERCRKTLAELEVFRSQINARLHVIEGELAETRHDVSVSRALLAEETARVREVNERRRRVIAEHVPYLAFRRPRSRDLLADAPVRHLDPADVEPAVPACLAHRVEVPRQLRSMLILFREVPVRWLTYVSAVVDMLDRIEMIVDTIQYATMRASAQFQARPAQTPTLPSLGLAASIQRVVSTHEEIVSRARSQTAQLDLSDLPSLSWMRARDRARDVLSLGDLIDANHGRSGVASAATQELEMISRVAGCLYARFGEVAPQIRLAWAQQLSQYDSPVNLRNLASLPRWSAIEYLDRRELQGLADWLFERVDQAQPQALALVSDLVRLCILLASHAPVNEIIAGHVHQPVAVQRGGRIDLTVDLAKVHVGMQVLLYADATAGPEVVARGIVEDVGDGKAAARVVDTTRPTITLSSNARAQFLEPDHPDLTALDDSWREPKLGAPIKSVGFTGARAGHR